MTTIRTGTIIVIENIAIKRLLTADDEAVRTPEEKTKLAYWEFIFSEQNLPRDGTILQTQSIPLAYGQIYYIRHDVQPSRRLSGSRGGKNEGVVSRDESKQDWGDAYLWKILAHPDSAGTGEVKYGDIIYLQNMAREDRWLSGGRGSGNKGVVTRDMFADPAGNEGLPTYQWKIRTPKDVGLD